MLKDILEVFNKNLEKYGEEYILKDYGLSDGTYVIVSKNGSIKAQIEIVKGDILGDKNIKEELMDEIKFYDYHSKILSTNKSIDSHKLIHSNSYLSFILKKDSLKRGKLKDEYIGEYYEALKYPEKRFSKYKDTKALYLNVEKEFGKPDIDEIEAKKTWMVNNLHSIKYLEGNNYLKIFFEETKEKYVEEYNKYLIPRIYVSNTHNVSINGLAHGIPVNNMTINRNKPYLLNNTKKIQAPYLVSVEAAVLENKFFDYLSMLASDGKRNIYIDQLTNEIIAVPMGEAPDLIMSGYFLKVVKDKELKIVDQENISNYRNKLKEPFTYNEIFKINYDMFSKADIKMSKDMDSQLYTKYEKRTDIGRLIDVVFFSGCLRSTFNQEIFTNTNSFLKKTILQNRDAIFDSIYKGYNNGPQFLGKNAAEIIEFNVENGNFIQAVRQLNLKYSLKSYMSMKDNGEEFTEESIASRETTKLILEFLRSKWVIL